jgi:hypothetical protein
VQLADLVVIDSGGLAATLRAVGEQAALPWHGRR